MFTTTFKKLIASSTNFYYGFLKEFSESINNLINLFFNEKKEPISNDDFDNKLFIVYTPPPDNNYKYLQIPKIQECTDQELIDTYNLINENSDNIFCSDLEKVLYQLEKEFLNRFNLKPVIFLDNKLQWVNQKLILRKEIRSYDKINDYEQMKKQRESHLSILDKTRTLTGIYFPRKGDSQIIEEKRNQLNEFSNSKLVDEYNSIDKLFGLHHQLLYIIAMHQVFLNRFKASPILLIANEISLGRKIQYLHIAENFMFINLN